MKTEEEIKNSESQLEELCLYAEVCAESDYGGREICLNDCETCENYFLFEGGDIIIEKLPPCDTIETFPERCSRSWKQSGIGRIHK